MIKSNKNSRFVLYTLEDIRDAKDVVLQIEDVGAQFDNGRKCFLCEVVRPGIYHGERDTRDLIREICELNNEKDGSKRKLHGL